MMKTGPAGWLVSAAAAGSHLCRAVDGSSPSEQEEVVTTEIAPVGLKEPVERSLSDISDAYTSKLD